jgi:hypothetical protein
VDLDAELVTPTGAAIVATAASEFVRWPEITPRRVGFGAGSRELPDRPNLLRVVLGEASAESTIGTQVLVEANVDDMSGELAAHALGALLDAGAVDAWATPTTMKKGRPGLCLAAVAPRARADEVAQAFLRETTTIGVRRHEVSRIERPRTMVLVHTAYGDIPLKVSGGPHGPAQVKPEFDACVAAAKAHDVPVRVVVAAALARYLGTQE